MAVAFARDATPQACAAAKLALIDELTGQLGRIGESADVVDLRTANSDVAFRVIRDGTLVFERDSGERVGLVVSIGRRYDDDAGKRALFVAAAKAAARRMASSDG